MLRIPLNGRSLLMLILAVPVALVLLTVMVRVLEPRLAFFPTRGEDTTPRDFNVPYEALTIETQDGERLRAWVMRPERVRARILYFHGNGGNLSMWAPIVVPLVARGYEVLAFDYRGFGLSTGRPTEQGLYRDVDAVVERFWRDGSNDVPVIYWGRSLGVSMASYAATVRRPDGVILESGFADTPSLLQRSPVFALLVRFSSYRFAAAEFLQRVHPPVPLLVLHGDHDTVIPIEQGRILFDAIPQPKRFVTIQGGDHNDTTPADPEVYWGAVTEFITNLRVRASA